MSGSSTVLSIPSICSMTASSSISTIRRAAARSPSKKYAVRFWMGMVHKTNIIRTCFCDYLFHGKYSPKEIMDSINRYYVNIIEDDVLTASNDRKWFRIICFLIATKAPISATGCGVNRPLIQEDRKNRRTLHKRKKATVLQRYYRL